MKQLIICLLLILTLISCISTKKYSIVQKCEVVCKFKNHKVVSYYPQIYVSSMDSLYDNINKGLKYGNFYVNYMCYDPKILERNYIGRYKILYYSDSMLCIEYFFKLSQYPGPFYSCLFVDLINLRVFTPDQLPVPDKSILQKYVEKFCNKTHIHINLNAYDVNNMCIITYGITKKHLILYTGNEGEGSGFYKIKIPLSELNYKINVSKIKYNEHGYIYY